MSLLSNTTVLLGKELRTEFRSRELLTTTIVFVLIVIVLFSFNLNPTTEESRHFGPGLLWLAFLLLLPIFAVLYNVPLLGVFPQLILVLSLGSLGLSVTGTAVSAISAQARMRELLLPLLLLPLWIPLLLPGTEATAALLSEDPVLRWDWIAILLVFDIIFLTAVWLFGEYLLEE